MWAIRRASVRIKSQPFSSVTFRDCNAKRDTRFSHIGDVGSGGAQSLLSDGDLHLRMFSSKALGPHSFFNGNHSFSSQAGSESESEKELIKEDDTSGSESETELIKEDNTSGSESDNELDLLDNEEEIVGNNGGKKSASSGLFKVLIDSSWPPKDALDKWAEGHEVTRFEISHAMSELRRRKMYKRALQLSEWSESQKNIEFSERDYASCLDLTAKLRGTQMADAYIEKIPASFRGEVVYRTLLANYVIKNDIKKAEKVFNKMRHLKFPVTAFACNQLLLLYKRTDKKKIADVLLLMEKEDIKPSIFTYRILIETKGMSNDIIGMEQVLETMKADGIEPDLRLQVVLARQYIYGGMTEKAKEVIKEMEGSNLKENRKACASLLTIYALLGSADDVNRVWEACQDNPRIDECVRAIEAFGKLNKVEEAEAVFEQMSKRWTKFSSKQYNCMLKVYANNKMLLKGKDIVKQMGEAGCRLGPMTWDALVKLYIEAGEIEKAVSVLEKASQQLRVNPLFMTYMRVLDHYAKEGDVHNAEKIFYRMRRDGYVSRYRQYNSLLQAYITAKVPIYGFRERMKADNMFPSKLLAERLALVDAFKKTAVSDLLD